MVWHSGFSSLHGEHFQDVMAVGRCQKGIEGTREKDSNNTFSDFEVLKDKKFRNHFEHFDDRLDKWAKTQEVSRTAPVDGWVTYGKANFIIEKESLLRIFDATESTVLFYGEKYPLEPVIEAIKKLQIKVHAVARDRLAHKRKQRF